MTSVAVVIAAFNAEDTLDEALRSVAAQSVRPTDVVVVDDGSRDRTVAVAERWKDELPLRIITHDRNRGVCAARMTAVDSISTPLVISLDADDAWLPSHLELVLAAHASHGGIVTPTAVPWSGSSPPKLDRRYQPLPRQRDLHALLRRNWIFSGSLFTRDDYLRGGGFYRFDGCEDWDLWLRLVRLGVTVTPVLLPTVLYRLRAGSLSYDAAALPVEIAVLEQFITETVDPRLVRAAARARDDRRARLALRTGYGAARTGDARAARREATAALRGEAAIALRAAGLLLAPRTMTRLRDRSRAR